MKTCVAGFIEASADQPVRGWRSQPACKARREPERSVPAYSSTGSAAATQRAGRIVGRPLPCVTPVSRA